MEKLKYPYFGGSINRLFLTFKILFFMLTIKTFLNLADTNGYKKGKAGILGYLFYKGLINATIYNYLRKYTKEQFYTILQDAINRYNALPMNEQIEQNFIIILQF